jgi:hypothetical protein
LIWLIWSPGQPNRKIQINQINQRDQQMIRFADKKRMRIRVSAQVVIGMAACLFGSPNMARAQLFEVVGTRAQGMGGAFVAVADDATATWWNPAGLAGGSFMGLAFEQSRLQAPAGEVGSGPAWKSTANTFFSVTVPSLGLSYYRLRISQIAPSGSSTVPGAGDREDGEGVALASIVLNEFGATFGQSIGSHLVLASTVRLLNGGLGTGAGPQSPVGNEALDAADDLDTDGDFQGDLDLGVMVTSGGLRFGATLKHVSEPEFGEGLSAFRLDRQGRVGASWTTTGQYGVLTGLTVAFDADVTTTRTALGDERHIATGAEAWLLNRRLGVRGGYSADTVDDDQTATSVGASLAPQSRLYVDWAMTFGSNEALEGWALSFRVTF